MKRKRIAKLFKGGLGIGLSFAMALTMLPPIEVKAELTEAGATGNEWTKAGSLGTSSGQTAEGQPFAQGAGGSQNFSSPALTVRKAELDDNGNKVDGAHDWIFAAAEAKYDVPEQEGGQGIILSISKDGGANWTYSYPMHFADSSASFANPVLIDEKKGDGTSDGKIYCFANAYPAGVSVGSDSTYPKAGTGYIGVGVNGKKCLALTADARKVGTNPTENTTDYAYYVSDTPTPTGGLYPVLSRQGGAESDYAVDAWHNLYKKQGQGYEKLMMTGESAQIQQNVFYKNAELRVYQASYVLYVTSDDNGATWSDPQILNPEISRDEHEMLSLSAGKGLRTSIGRLVVPVDNRASYNETGQSISYGESHSRASIFWRGIEEDPKWHRSKDDVSFKITDKNTQAEKESWTGAGEIVEISDGKLRMFFQNEDDKAWYVDATRGSMGENFTFETPVATGTSVTKKAQIGALKYSKQVDGQNAVMLAMPTGVGFTNGMIDTFTPGQNDVMARLEKNDFRVDSTNFSDACMDEMAYGSKIAFLWESGTGSVSFQAYNTLDVTKGSFIPKLEIDLDLKVGDSYERTYSGVTQAYLEPDIPVPTDGNVLKIDFDKGELVEKNVPALYAYGAESNPYQSQDERADISNAEFTFKRVSNEAPYQDSYVIYSEGEQRYLTYYNTKDTLFTTTARNYMKVVKNSGGFVIQKDGAKNTLLFDTAKKRFDGDENYSESSSAAGKDVTVKLLMKLNAGEEAEESPLISGYREVSEITTGRKYLIVHETGEDSAKKAVVLYPRNSLQNTSKLVNGTRNVEIPAQKTVTITAKSAGESSVTVNSIAYHVTAKIAKVTVPKGGKAFIRTEDTDISIEDANVAAAKTGAHTVKGLFDRTESKADWLGLSEAYENERNTDLNMSRAEFVLKQEGQYYTIYNKYTKSYLTNYDATSYFQDTKATHEIVPEGGGTDKSFSITRQGNSVNNNRIVYFWRKQMKFDAVNDRHIYWVEPEGDCAFEFLKKKEGPSAPSDPVPGYVRANEIEDGKTYLITKYISYTNPDTGKNDLAIIILYADNGLSNMSKVYRNVLENGVWVTAKGNENDRTTVTVGGIPYEITIGEPCNHEGTEHELRNISEPTCAVEGYTGDVYCTFCQGLVEEGQARGKLRHTPGSNWTVIKKPTIDVPGKQGKLCTVCGDVAEEKDVSCTPVEVKEELQAKIVEIEQLKESDYTAASWSAVSAALGTANEAAKQEATEQNKKAMVDAYHGLKTAVGNLQRADSVAAAVVTFNANGGSFAGNAQEKTATADTLNKVEPPQEVPTKQGHRFTGWYIAQTGTNDTPVDFATWTVKANTTLYARWAPIKVTFYTNGGSFADGKQYKEVTADESGVFAVPEANRDGHSFKGWFTAEKDGTEVEFSEGTASITEDTTLYAQWDPFTATFNPCGGTFDDQTTAPKTEKAGIDGKITAPQVSYEDHVFDGWFTTETGGTKVEFINNKKELETNSTALYAHWTNGQETTITVTPAGPLSMTVGDEAKTLTATGVPAGQKASWKAEPSGIVTVTPADDGNSATVTAVKAGDATITVSADGATSATVRVTVKAAATAQDEIKVTPAGPLTMTVGGTETVTASGVPDGQKASWTASPEGIVTVTESDDGKSATVTAVSEGTATITVSADGAKSATVRVTVNPAAVTPTVTVTPAGPLSMTVGGEPETLTATGVPAGKKASWKAEPSGIVTVTPADDGNSATVTAVSKGNATITVSAEGATSATVRVTVNPAATAADEIKVDPAGPLNLTVGGEPETLTATGVPAGQKASWKAEPSGIVTVTPADDGKSATVTAVSEGNATITVSAEGATSATVSVTVKAAATAADEIKVDPAGPLNLTVGGEPAKLTATGAPEGKTVVWNAQPAGIVEVKPTENNSAEATVTAIAAGTATITVSAEGAVSAEVLVTVTGEQGGGNNQGATEIKVTFHANEGHFDDAAVTREVTALEGGIVNRPADPVREGYTFAGWYDAVEGGNLADFGANGAAVFTASTTLYAHWTLNTATPPEQGGDVYGPGAVETVNGIVYRVLNADKKTAVVAKGPNKKKVKIANVIYIKGVKCKVEQIGSKAFKGCKKLQQVTIGKNVTTINKNAFQNCAKLKTVTLSGTKLKTVKSGAFKKTSKKLTVKVPNKIKKSKAKANKLLKTLKKGGNKKVKIK